MVAMLYVAYLCSFTSPCCLHQVLLHVRLLMGSAAEPSAPLVGWVLIIVLGARMLGHTAGGRKMRVCSAARLAGCAQSRVPACRTCIVLLREANGSWLLPIGGGVRADEGTGRCWQAKNCFLPPSLLFCAPCGSFSSDCWNCWLELLCQGTERGRGAVGQVLVL